MSSQPQNIRIHMHDGSNYKGDIYLSRKADPAAGEGQSEYLELMDSLRANRSHRDRLSQGIKTLMSGFFCFGEGAIPEFVVNADEMSLYDRCLTIPYDWDHWPIHWERRHANAYQVSVDIRADAIFLNYYDADGCGCCDEEEKTPLGRWSSWDWEMITKGVVEIAKVLGFALVGTTRAKPIWRKTPEATEHDWPPGICLPFIKEEKRVSVAAYEWATILAGDILHDSIKDGRLERALQERTDDRDAARRAFVEVVDRINMSSEKHSGASGTPER
jgi:hypothetical protein